MLLLIYNIHIMEHPPFWTKPSQGVHRAVPLSEGSIVVCRVPFYVL